MSTTHTALATTSQGVLEAIQVPTSAPGPDQVLVKIEYSGVTPLDTSMVDFGQFVQSYPARIGFNAAGTVTKIGGNVQNLTVGDRVRINFLDFLRH